MRLARIWEIGNVGQRASDIAPYSRHLISRAVEPKITRLSAHISDTA